MSTQDTKRKREEGLFVSGHRACPGCGMAVAVRHILEAAGENIIVVTPTGCLETFTSPFGFSCWGVPWIHHLFENGPAIATGIAAALVAQKRDSERVLVIEGDGSTFDTGFGALSGMMERGDRKSNKGDRLIIVSRRLLLHRRYAGRHVGGIQVESRVHRHHAIRPGQRKTQTGSD